MSFTDILIILGCVAAGYWIVSSVMGPGIDITRRDRPADDRAAPPHPPRTAVMADWYLVLDVSRTASRAEIEAAFLRQQKKALSDRDPLLLQRLKLARDAGLAHSRQTSPH